MLTWEQDQDDGGDGLDRRLDRPAPPVDGAGGQRGGPDASPDRPATSDAPDGHPLSAQSRTPEQPVPVTQKRDSMKN